MSKKMWYLYYIPVISFIICNGCQQFFPLCSVYEWLFLYFAEDSSPMSVPKIIASPPHESPWWHGLRTGVIITCVYMSDTSVFYQNYRCGSNKYRLNYVVWKVCWTPDCHVDRPKFQKVAAMGKTRSEFGPNWK